MRTRRGLSKRLSDCAKPRLDGNLLVDDLPHDHAVVEAILDGRFKPTYWAQQMLPDHLFTKRLVGVQRSFPIPIRLLGGEEIKRGS
jgi:hypothetical protein